MKEASPGLGAVPPQRAWPALARVMDGTRPADRARLMRRLGVLDALIPEVAAVFEVPQNYYHHTGVWEHTLEVLDRLEELMRSPGAAFPACASGVASQLQGKVEGGFDRRTYLTFAALIHDIGKAATMSVEPSGRIRFGEHQREGALVARDIAGRLSLGYRGSHHLAGLFESHMKFGFLMKEGESTETRLKAVRELGDRCVDVALLSLADRMATRGEAATREAGERFKRLLARVLNDYFWDRGCPPLLCGRDAVIHSGVGPGPEVGRKLFDARVAQREGIVSNRQQALEYLAPDFKGKITG